MVLTGAGKKSTLNRELSGAAAGRRMYAVGLKSSEGVVKGGSSGVAGADEGVWEWPNCGSGSGVTGG